MSDASMGAADGMGQEPTEEELRAYLMELRQADPAEFLMQAVNILVTGAQAKIGLADGRLLIDAMAALVNAGAGRLPEQLSSALGNAVAQLQAAQVQAEKEMASMPGAGEAAAAAPGEAASPTGDAASAGPTVSEPQQKMTDRLWVPGKGAPPAR